MDNWTSAIQSGVEAIQSSLEAMQSSLEAIQCTLNDLRQLIVQGGQSQGAMTPQQSYGHPDHQHGRDSHYQHGWPPVSDMHQATLPPHQPILSMPTSYPRQGETEEAGSSSSIQHEPAQSSKQMRFPLRPGLGEMGIRCIVKANHFFAELPDKDLHQYDVSITPEVASRGVNRAVMDQLVELHRCSCLGMRLPAYDGRKSLYTAGELPFDSKEFKIILVDKDDRSGGARGEKEFKVVIKLASQPYLHQADAPQEALKVLDVVLRELPTSRYSPVGRSFYAPTKVRKQPLSEGLEIWRVFHQRIRPTQMGLSLNIDMSSTAFIKPLSVIGFVSQLLNWTGVPSALSDSDRVKIKKALRGVMVEGLKHHGNMRRKYRISGLTSQDTRELTFPVDELGTTKSVIQYFREKYGVDIGLTHWPCLQVGNQQRANYLPMEVCQIVEGQRYSKQLNERQITALLKTTHKQPKDREQEILQVVASQDWPEISKYVASVSAQAHRQEPIQNLHLTRPHPHTGKIQCAGMIRTLIKSFCEASRTQKMPERIIFYRDGVSEGQIYQVLHAELDAIRKDPYWNKLLWYCVENGSYNGCFLPVRQESVTHESAGWRNEERNQPKNVEPIKQESESGHNWDGITPPASGNNLEDIPSPASGNNWEDIPVPASGNNWNDIPPTESGNNWEDLPPPVTDENEWSHHGWNNWDVIPPPESGYYNWEDIPAPASGNNWNDIPAPASGNNWNDIPSPAFGNWEDILASGNWEDIPAPASGNNWNDIPPTESGNNWEDLPPPVTDENEWSHHGGNNWDVIPQPEYDYGDWEDIPWLVAQDG